MLTGVVEVGLFCGMAKAAYFGNDVRILLLMTSGALISSSCLNISHQFPRPLLH